MTLPIISLDANACSSGNASDSDDYEISPSPIVRRRELRLSSDCGTSAPSSPKLVTTGSFRMPARPTSSLGLDPRSTNANGLRTDSLSGQASPTSPVSLVKDLSPFIRHASLRVKQQLKTRLSEPLKTAGELSRSLNRLIQDNNNSPPGPEWRRYCRRI